MTTTTAPTPPPDTDPDLTTALARWSVELGAEHVITDPDRVAEFSDPYSPQSFGYHPCAVLQPATVEEIQSILRIANETAVPVWFNSQGRNNGYGGAAAADQGTVVVNLRRMNTVLEINDELGYVVVEPGVSFFDLYEAVRKSGKRLMIDVPDLGWGSVIGNTLDHGNGYTLFGDHAAAACGLEVVLPTGEIVRTGMGALDGTETWHLNKRGFGPSVDGLFMQSNMGVVTKMGVWVMPRPDSYMDCWVTVARENDLEALVDTFRPFMIDGTVNNCPTLFNPLAAMSTKVSRNEVWPEADHVPHHAASEIGKQAADLGPWNIRFALYGDAVIVQRNFDRIRDAFAPVDDATVSGTFLDLDEIVPESDQFDQKQKVHAGVPDLSMLKLLEWDGGRAGGHLSFASTVPLTGRHVRDIVELVRTRQEAAGLDYHAGIILYPRFAIHISLLIYALGDEDKTRRVHDLYAELVVEAARKGYGEYRTHLAFMDLVASQYAYNDQSLLRLVEKVKDTLDPNGILAPGKQGIWPRRQRSEHERGSGTHRLDQS